MRWAAVAVAMVTLAGCDTTGPTEVSLGQEFELAPNQSVVVTGSDLTIGFRRVVGDARCPIDALCVADGGAAVELATFGSTASGSMELGTPFPRTWINGGYQIEVLELRPERTAGGTIRAEDYRVRLLVNSTR